MRTEFTAEIVGDVEDVEAILEGVAKSGVVIHSARIQGRSLDVGPLRDLALAEEDDEEEAEEEATVAFASDAAEKAAAELPEGALEGREPTGQTGFTVADIEAVKAELAEAES